jgi:photosystem II stability/assembly factor-like uncharacterized protein
MHGSVSSVTIIAATSNGLAAATGTPGADWTTELLLPGVPVNCLASSPSTSNVIYAGTDGQGIRCSQDRGETWQHAGMEGALVKALAVDPTSPGTLYAGVRPAGIFKSIDNGSTWKELRTFRKVKRWFWFSPASKPFTAYVQSIVLSGPDSKTVVAGVEAGAVVISTDGGRTWLPHRRGALRDCHMLARDHRDGRWVYEAGGSGGGAAFSPDGGLTWHKRSAGLDRHYGWAVAVDPTNPRTWYVSMSTGAFKAHSDGKAEAFIFRSTGGGPWHKLTGGLPQPLPHMPYGLLTHAQSPGHVYATLANGHVWHSPDHGDTWTRLPFTLDNFDKSVILL